jgi:hypothetical protein
MQAYYMYYIYLDETDYFLYIKSALRALQSVSVISNWYLVNFTRIR